MNKQEYINQLRKELNGLMPSDIDDIIRDQEEYFREAASSGRNEASVIISLGEASTLAKELKAEYQIKIAESETTVMTTGRSIFKAIMALCVLAPFNLIFILGPFLAFCGVLLALWTVDVVFAVLGFVGVFVGFIFIFLASPWVGLTGFFGALAMFGFGLLSLCVTYYITVGFFKMTISFMKWNINFVTGGAKDNL